MCIIDETPHDWLFPRMAAVVHHAGAGTTGAGLRAGVPAITVPILADQPFWSDRLERIGVSPGAIPFRELTAPCLAELIRQAITEPAYQRRAAAFGAVVRAEDGAGRVNDLLATLPRRECPRS
jgi:UDP:flavonoid glycosyltransferase YjiC (YdhE family)